MLTAGSKQSPLTESEFRLLQGIYTSINNPAAYGSVKNLQLASGLPRHKVVEFLKSSKTYTKFKTFKKPPKRLKTRSLGINHIWSLDVAYMEKLSRENDNVKYLLVAVDCLSRYLRVQPMKSKTAVATRNAFEKMLDEEQNIVPVKVWVDQGSEFEGAFKQNCESRNIAIYHTYSDSKSALAERHIRSLKNVLYKFFEERKTTRYIGQLQRFVNLLNSRVNASIQMAPSKVRYRDTANLLKRIDPSILARWPATRNLGKKGNTRRSKYSVGDSVRIAQKKKTFKKGYKQNFTDEVFKVYRVSKPTDQDEPITYSIKDSTGEPILGRFYDAELVPYTYVEDRHRARHQRIL